MEISTFGIDSSTGDFSLSNNCPASLAPSSTCTATITYTPHAQGPASAGLVILFARLTSFGGSFVRQARLSLSGSGASPSADSDGDGVPNGLESSLGMNPLVKDNDIFGNARLFAMQQYRDFLGREGDADGITTWSNQLDSGATTRAQVVDNFFNSGEFQGVIAPVARLYFAYFLRVPDFAGLNYWVGNYKGGNSLQSISDAFAASAEFASRYGSLDNGQFVDRVYQNILGRAPDNDGRNFWTGQLDSGAMTRGQVMLAFSDSSEYRDLIQPQVYVTMIYMGMLRRTPEPGGFSFWVTYLDDGNSGLDLINAVIASDEYHKRFLP